MSLLSGNEGKLGGFSSNSGITKSYFEIASSGIKSWKNNHPDMVKTCKVASLIFALGAGLSPLFVNIPLSIGFTASLIFASGFLFFSHLAPNSSPGHKRDSALVHKSDLVGLSIAKDPSDSGVHQRFPGPRSSELGSSSPSRSSPLVLSSVEEARNNPGVASAVNYFAANPGSYGYSDQLTEGTIANERPVFSLPSVATPLLSSSSPAVAVEIRDSEGNACLTKEDLADHKNPLFFPKPDAVRKVPFVPQDVSDGFRADRFGFGLGGMLTTDSTPIVESSVFSTGETRLGQPSDAESSHLEAGKRVALSPNESPVASLASAAAPVIRPPDFAGVDSSKLIHFEFEGKSVRNRADFLALKQDEFFPPPVIGKSSFVSNTMAEHLMRNKRDSALNSKFYPGTSITNMEAALHTFVTPVGKVLKTGDYLWLGRQAGTPFADNQFREVILSFAVQPDFEHDDVMLPVVRVRDEAVGGWDLGDISSVPTREEKADKQKRSAYDQALLEHMVYHLSPDHRIPARSEIDPKQIMMEDVAINKLEELIRNPQKEGRFLKDKYMYLPNGGGAVISLEMLYQMYLKTVRNEFAVLNANAPQGFVYTIDPPKIFAQMFNSKPNVLNRLQALAFQSLSKEEGLFSNLKVIGFNDFSDKTMVPLLQNVFPDVQVLSKSSLFEREGCRYIGPSGLPIVEHNNSDAFGQNIETEELWMGGSMDALLGTYSNAPCVVRRNRSDLLSKVENC